MCYQRARSKSNFSPRADLITKQSSLEQPKDQQKTSRWNQEQKTQELALDVTRNSYSGGWDQQDNTTDSEKTSRHCCLLLSKQIQFLGQKVPVWAYRYCVLFYSSEKKKSNLNNLPPCGPCLLPQKKSTLAFFLDKHVGTHSFPLGQINMAFSHPSTFWT